MCFVHGGVIKRHAHFLPNNRKMTLGKNWLLFNMDFVYELFNMSVVGIFNHFIVITHQD